jgi:hypothetical protein
MTPQTGPTHVEGMDAAKIALRAGLVSGKLRSLLKLRRECKYIEGKMLSERTQRWY